MIVRYPVWGPPDVGAKVAASVQMLPGAMVGVRLAQGAVPPGATVNWDDVTVIPETTRSKFPEFDRVNCAGAEVLPTGTFPSKAEAGEREIFGGAPPRSNVAVTFLWAFMVTVQVPVPEHPPPDQPVNTEPVTGQAVSVTTAPSV
jgi:hypothetical protein